MKFVLAICLALVSSSAFAEDQPEKPEPPFRTARDLRGPCESLIALGQSPTANDGKAADCADYVTKWADAWRGVKSASTSMRFGRNTCLPSTVLPVTFARLFLHQLKERPKSLDDNAAGVLFASWRNAWPCPDK
jgi:hypothetical protein